MKKYLLCFILLILLPLSGYSQCKYLLKCNGQILSKTGKIIESQVGILELSNRNDGLVNKYVEFLDLPRGSPYCMAGIYWSFAAACKNLNLPAQEIPIPKTGLANRTFDFAKSKGRRAKYIAKANDLIIWRRANSNHGHIEFIISCGDAGNVRTVGFNSSKIIDGKTREGVFYQKRNIMHPIGRIRIRGIVGYEEK